MHFSITPSNGVPIYEQFVRQVKYAVAEGILLPGQVIPSVRETAKQATVNPNTVQRAFLELQNDQVIEPLRGRGMVVCKDAKRQCVADRNRVLREQMQWIVGEAIRSGLDRSQLEKMFEQSIEHANKLMKRQSKGDS